MKSKTLLTACLAVLISSCLFAGIYGYRSGKSDAVENRSAHYGRTLENDDEDEDQAEFIFWKSIPRHLLMIDR